MDPPLAVAAAAVSSDASAADALADAVAAVAVAAVAAVVVVVVVDTAGGVVELDCVGGCWNRVCGVREQLNNDTDVDNDGVRTGFTGLSSELISRAVCI